MPLPITEISGLEDLGPIQGAKPRRVSDSIVDQIRSQRPTAADFLADGAKTYAERNTNYGENWRMVGPVMTVLFPHGIPSEVLHSDRWHLFELLVVKLTRFATSKLTHRDSIHDAMVYAAMAEASLVEVESKPMQEVKL